MKRILSLDGGGIRGIISLQILKKIEDTLCQLHGNDDLVLSDYFDLIAGTSTGAIIATGLSLGWKVKKIQDLYHAHGEQMFDHGNIVSQAWELINHGHRYRHEKLESILKGEFGDITLGSDELRTLLMVVIRNTSLDTPWIMTNWSEGKYFEINRKMELWKLVRASTAAPSFFEPETMSFGDDKFSFIDGSVSSFTNPAFCAFIRATAKPYGIQWPVGENNLLLVSVGTGIAPHMRKLEDIRSETIASAVEDVPKSLILSTVLEQDMFCRIFGKCLNGHQIDEEIGDLLEISHKGKEHYFTYVRYNGQICQSGLRDLGITGINSADIINIDCVKHTKELVEVGSAMAESQVDVSHFFKGTRDNPSSPFKHE